MNKIKIGLCFLKYRKIEQTSQEMKINSFTLRRILYQQLGFRPLTSKDSEELSKHLDGKYLILPSSGERLINEYHSLLQVFRDLASLTTVADETELFILVERFNDSVQTFSHLRHQLKTIKVSDLEIVRIYFKMNSIKAIGREHLSSDSYTRKVLNAIGIIRYPTNKTFAEHISGKYWRPLVHCHEMIIGIILGDGNLRTTHRKKPIDIQKYQLALQTLQRLGRVQKIRTITELMSNVQEYNKAVKSLRENLKTAYFRLCKSNLEEPWVRHVGHRLQTDNYSVNITASKSGDLVYLVSLVSVNLYVVFYECYKGKNKKLPLTLDYLTPEALLYLHIGDASVLRFILIYSSSFTYTENERLLQLFNQLGIKGSVFSNKDSRTGKIYHGIQISKTSTQRYLEYLDQAPKEALTLAKQLFPWKFSIVNRKKDVIRDPDYILTFLDLLAHSLVGSEEKLTARVKPLLRRFPWNETLFHLTLY